MAQYQGAEVASTKRAFMQSFGNAVTFYDKTPAIGALLALADTVDLIRIPGGTQITDLETWNDDLDTATTLQVKIGYRKVNSGGVLTDDDDYFVAAGATNFQAAVTKAAATQYSFVPVTFNEDVFITLTVTAAATSTAITTGTISTIARGVARGIK